jgi:hypothetical protein
LLSQDDDDGYLVYQLVVEGVDPGLVATERGASRLKLTEDLRDAIDQLAMEVEDVAYASVGEARVPRAPV